MSGGGGSICSSGFLPFLTMKVIAIPQLTCRSKWQCMNHTPDKTKHFRKPKLAQQNEQTHQIDNRQVIYLPGFMALNLMVTQPFLGMATVF